MMDEVWDADDFYAVKDDPKQGPADPQQRRALILVACTGFPESVKLVTFINEKMVIAWTDAPGVGGPPIDMAVRFITEFVESETDTMLTNLGEMETIDLLGDLP